MPHKAREKSPESIYHIICRSISEVQLFKADEDKSRYLDTVKRYADKYKCSVYAYCLMDNHVHMHFDPRGADVSKFMHSLNTSYVRYFNNKYERHGALFQDRFESRILDTNEYNLTVSAYIHNNPKDIEAYNGKEQLYPYSSYGIYIGIRNDPRNLIDTSFISSLFNATSVESFRHKYQEFVSYERDVGGLGKLRKDLSKAVENEYKSERMVILRDYQPSKIVSYISDKLLIPAKGSLQLKSKKRVHEFRAFCAYALRVLCGFTYKKICSNMYNITVSGCSRLCEKGYLLQLRRSEYETLFSELLLLAT